MLIKVAPIYGYMTCTVEDIETIRQNEAPKYCRPWYKASVDVQSLG